MPHNVDVTEIIVQLIDFFPRWQVHSLAFSLKIHFWLFLKRFHKERPQHIYTTNKVNDIICFFTNGLFGSIKVVYARLGGLYERAIPSPAIHRTLLTLLSTSEKDVSLKKDLKHLHRTSIQINIILCMFH